jgi:hypothetical protein
MSSADNDLIERLHAVAREFEMPLAPVADDVRRGRRRVRRNRSLAAGAVVAAVALLIGTGAALSGRDLAGSNRIKQLDPPRSVVKPVPVWYDAKGLHHGAVAEHTPVDLMERARGSAPGQFGPVRGALALVRNGALYLDPKTNNVWWHPWGGTPRIVGHDSEAGPGGDPTGDIAAWFEGSDADAGGPGDLVVYDTATGRQLSRTHQPQGVTYGGSEHRPVGNGFLDVSTEDVLWRSIDGEYRFDLRTRETTEAGSDYGEGLLDERNGATALGSLREVAALHAATGPKRSYKTLEAAGLRLSPSGRFVLGAEFDLPRHAAAIIDLDTGVLWREPKNAYPVLSWSYGDMAMIGHLDGQLLACDAARRVCHPVTAQQPFLLPTN